MELTRNVQIKSSVIQCTCYGWKLEGVHFRGEGPL